MDFEKVTKNQKHCIGCMPTHWYPLFDAARSAGERNPRSAPTDPPIKSQACQSNCSWEHKARIAFGPTFVEQLPCKNFWLCHRTSTSVRGFLMQKSILVACYSGIKENCLYSWEYIFDKKRSKGFHEEELPAHTLFSTLFSLRFFFFCSFWRRHRTGQTELPSPGSNRALPGLFMLLIKAGEDSPRSNSPRILAFPYLLSWIFESSFCCTPLWPVDNIQFFNGT